MQNLFRVKLAKPTDSIIKPKLHNDALRTVSNEYQLTTLGNQQTTQTSFNLPKGIIISSVSNSQKKDLNTISVPTTIVMNTSKTFPNRDFVEIKPQQQKQQQPRITSTITPLNSGVRPGLQYLKTYNSTKSAGKTTVSLLQPLVPAPTTSVDRIISTPIIAPPPIILNSLPMTSLHSNTSVIENINEIDDFSIIEETHSPMHECEEEEYLLDDDEIGDLHVTESEDNQQDVTYDDVLQHENSHIIIQTSDNNDQSDHVDGSIVKDKQSVDEEIDNEIVQIMEQDKTLIYDRKVEVLKPSSMINVQISNGVLSDPNGPIKMLVQAPVESPIPPLIISTKIKKRKQNLGNVVSDFHILFIFN